MRYGTIAAAGSSLLLCMCIGFAVVVGGDHALPERAIAEPMAASDVTMPEAEPVIDMGIEGFGASFVPYVPPEPEEYEEGYDNEWYEEEYYYEPYYDTYWQTVDESDGISADEFQWLGVVEDGDVTYTWYSQNVLPGGGLDELNENGRHVEGGFVVDGDGYIAVASSDYEKGTVLDTPFGEAKVYDTGCASGTVDVYTNF